MAKPFIAALKQYFNTKPGQTLTEFKKEADELTRKDQEEMAPLLSAAIGEEVMLPPRPETAAA